MTKVPGLVLGISKKRLERPRERAGSEELELLGVQYFGHSLGEHLVRLVAGSLVVGAADADISVVVGASVVTAAVEISGEALRAVLAIAEDTSCRSTNLPGAVGMEKAKLERRSKDKLALELNFW